MKQNRETSSNQSVPSSRGKPREELRELAQARIHAGCESTRAVRAWTDKSIYLGGSP